MKTEEPTEPITVTDLLRITVIKRKHATQIREAFRETPRTKFSDVEILYHLDEWDALLCRRKDNQRYVILQEGAYYDWVRVNSGPGKYSSDQAEAHQYLMMLPQLFLD
jgi:hypothetical protein